MCPMLAQFPHLVLCYTTTSPPSPHPESRHIRQPSRDGPLLGFKIDKNLLKIDDLAPWGLLGVHEGAQAPRDGLMTGQDDPKTCQHGPKRAQFEGGWSARPETTP
eukprot:5274901-Pyramimonas_sp.AAC.1